MIKYRKKIKLRYKKERVILSDVLPYELPIIFNNRYFYRFLVSNKIEINDKTLTCKKDISKEALAVLKFIFSPYIDIKKEKDLLVGKACDLSTLNSIPFQYKIKHKEHKHRRLSIIHPANQIEIVSFYVKYKSLILYYCKKDRFSLRHPESVACYFYYKDRLHDTLLGRKRDNIEVFFNEYENLKTFFSYKEYSNIYKFYEDYKYQNAEKRFNHLHKFDIQSCFDSIYTHSIGWATNGGKSVYKNHIGKKYNTFGDQWDNVIRHANYDETNGIIIGPEFSRIFAEVILQYIDNNVEKALKDKGYKWKDHYICYRYVDDIFFYYNDEEVLNTAMITYENLLNEYKLNISKEKSFDMERPFITPISMAKIQIDNLLNDNIKFHLNDNIHLYEHELSNSEDKKEFSINEYEDLTDEKISESINNKDFLFLNSKEFNREYKSLMVLNNVLGKDVINYTLAVMSTKLERLFKKFDKINIILSKSIHEDRRVEECKKKKEQIENMLLRYLINLLDVIFFLYSYCERVNTTLKMMNILNIIIIYVANNYEDKNHNIIQGFSSRLRDEIYQKIQYEIINVFKSSKFNIETQIETLYFLITLKSLPKQYNIDSDTLNKYFIDNKGEKTDKSKLNAISIIILLYYYGNTEMFREDKKYLMEGVIKKFKDSYLGNKNKNTELVILTLDLLSCPYINHNYKNEISKIMGIDDEQHKLIKKYFKRHKFMFTKWTNVNLTKEIGAKISQEVYT